MANPIKQIKMNQLEYNSNRDPQVYRRVVNKPFNLKVNLIGSGKASVVLSVAGKTLSESSVSLPGVFEATPSFDTPGTRVGTITVKVGSEAYHANVRFDVMEHAWIG